MICQRGPFDLCHASFSWKPRLRETPEMISRQAVENVEAGSKRGKLILWQQMWKQERKEREDRREIDYEAAPLNLFSRRLPGAALAIPVWPPTVMNASFCVCHLP